MPFGKTVFILAFLLITIHGHSQRISKTASLDSFFAGIPLKQSYDKWVKFIVEDSTLGIDSARPRGLYSSFKTGRTNHFPFPDSIPVKILLETELYIDPSKKIPSDTPRSIMIEGIFEDSKKGMESAAAYFKVLYTMLSPYYRQWDGVVDEKAGWLLLSEGKNRNFPEILLQFDYFEEGRFYYVLLWCGFRRTLHWINR